MLIKNWEFKGNGTSGNVDYPYQNSMYDPNLPDRTWKSLPVPLPLVPDNTCIHAWGKLVEVSDLPGVNGLHSNNPLSIFFAHMVISIDQSGFGGLYYDPSYAIMTESMYDWEEQSVAGYGRKDAVNQRYVFRGNPAGREVDWTRIDYVPPEDIVIVGAVIFLSLLSSIDDSILRPRLRVVRGAIEGGSVYVCGISRRPAWRATDPINVDGGGGLVVVHAPLSCRQPPAVGLIRGEVDGAFSTRVFHRWQFDRRRLHYLVWSGNPGNLHLEEPVLRFPLIWSAPTLGVLLAGCLAHTTLEGWAHDRFREIRTGIRAASYFTWLDLSQRVPEADQPLIFADFLPASDGQYELYISEPLPGRTPAADRARLTRWGSHPIDGPDKTGQWTDTGTWLLDKSGPFVVLPDGDVRYIVTNDGRLHRLPAGGKPDTPSVVVWSKSPIRAVIHDVDRGRWFAFTREQFFPVGNPAAATPHTVGAFPNRDARAAFAAVLRCGRAVRGLPALDELAPLPRLASATK